MEPTLAAIQLLSEGLEALLKRVEKLENPVINESYSSIPIEVDNSLKPGEWYLKRGINIKTYSIAELRLIATKLDSVSHLTVSNFIASLEHETD